MLQHTDYGNFRIYQQNAVNYLVQVVLSRLVFALFYLSPSFFSRIFAVVDGDNVTHLSILCNFAVFLEQNTLHLDCVSFWYLVSRYNFICCLPQNE